MGNKDSNLFVKNVDPSKSPKDFHAFFTAQFQNQIVDTLLKTDTNGESLGYGYV